MSGDVLQSDHDRGPGFVGGAAVNVPRMPRSVGQLNMYSRPLTETWLFRRDEKMIRPFGSAKMHQMDPSVWVA